MESKEKNKIILRNYNKVYTLEQKIYTIGNWRLPSPVELVPGMFFVIMAAGLFIINNKIVKIPIPSIAQYILIPYFLASKMTKTKKDGKKLAQYYKDYIEYLSIKGKEFENFEKVEKIKEIQFFK